MRQEHRDHRLRVGRQGLLRLHAVLPKLGHRGRGVGIRHVQLGQRTTVVVIDPLNDGLVEIDAPEPLDALRFADQVDRPVVLAQHRGVERAAPEVVHRDRVALLQIP
jgi:hypothetical protein